MDVSCISIVLWVETIRIYTVFTKSGTFCLVKVFCIKLWHKRIFDLGGTKVSLQCIPCSHSSHCSLRFKTCVLYQRIQHIQNLQKRHNYTTAQRIFNGFCRNENTISWHIHLRISIKSFIKFLQKLWQIYGKTKVSLFFWTRCIYLVRAAGQCM